MKNKLSNPLQKGFTLVELLIVMAILGVLTTLIAGGFRSAQIRGRDAQRKSDLKELANALELFYTDYGVYPSESGGSIAACPYDPVLRAGTNCVWGQDELTDGKSTYFKTLPADPTNGKYYVYEIVPGSLNQKYRIYARLENLKDKDCISGDCEAPLVTVFCGSELCNYATVSSNTSITE